MPPPPKITAAIGFLTFASIVLTIVAYLNNWRISLIVVSPSSVPGTLQSPAIEGPTVILNVFGSCGRPSMTSNFICVSNPRHANYSKLSILPANVPFDLKPPGSFLALFWLALWLWFLGLVFLFMSNIYVYDKHNSKAYASILAHIFLHFGFSIWLGVFVFFLKAADDFNQSLKNLAVAGLAPGLFAQSGIVFPLIGAAYGCTLGIYVLSQV